MRKTILFLFAMVLLIMPIGASATTISSTSVNYPSSKKIGDTFSVSFNINFNDLKMATLDTEGVYMVAIEFSFDDTVLALTGASSTNFEQVVFKDDETGHYGILAIVKDSNMSNRCADQLLYCGNYLESLTFVVKNTTKTSTNIIVYEYGVGVFPLNSAGEYDIDNIKELTYKNTEVKPIEINQSSTTVTPPPTTIVESSKPTVTAPKNNDSTSSSSSSTTTDPQKSSNKYLKALTIKDHEIDFVKNKYTYKLAIPSDVNSLYVTAEVEDEKSTYVITGAEDLKANNDRVRIKVTAENGDTVTYNLIIEKEEQIDDTSSEEITSKLNLVVYIVLGSITFITIICIIVSINNKRKLKKLLEE